MKIRTIKGIRLDDDEVIDHLVRMSAGTAYAECDCDDCALWDAVLRGETLTLRPDGDGYWRLIYEANLWP